MEEQRTNAVPVIIGVLLFLALLYLGTYFALVLPGGTWSGTRVEHYRVGNCFAEYAFWPLEQIDRRLCAYQWNSVARRLWDDSP
jgi:hypothetical protein